MGPRDNTFPLIPIVIVVYVCPNCSFILFTNCHAMAPALSSAISLPLSPSPATTTAHFPQHPFIIIPKYVILCVVYLIHKNFRILLLRDRKLKRIVCFLSVCVCVCRLLLNWYCIGGFSID